MKRMMLRITNRLFLFKNCISYRIVIVNEHDRYLHEDTNNIREKLGAEEILLFYFNSLPRVCIVLGKDNNITQIHLSDTRQPRGERLRAFFSGLLEESRLRALRNNHDPDSINVYTWQDIMHVLNTKLNKMLTDASLINSSEIDLI